MSLAEDRCVPCRGETPPLSPDEVHRRLSALPGWEAREEAGVPRLVKVFTFPDFSAALAFAGRIGAEADQQDHHPAILVEWGKTTVSWWTHRIHGLHPNDFIMAARTDALNAP